MTEATQTKVHTIDASGKRLGRLASEIAHILMGKDEPDYVPHLAANVRVVVEHASKLHIDEKKREQTEYDRYSGFPGGRSVRTMQNLIEHKGYREVLRKSVYGMLPSNRLRAVRMKHLTINEE